MAIGLDIAASHNQIFIISKDVGDTIGTVYSWIPLSSSWIKYDQEKANTINLGPYHFYMSFNIRLKNA